MELGGVSPSLFVQRREWTVIHGQLCEECRHGPSDTRPELEQPRFHLEKTGGHVPGYVSNSLQEHGRLQSPTM